MAKGRSDTIARKSRPETGEEEISGLDPEYEGKQQEEDCPRNGGIRPLTTSEILTEKSRRDISTPGDGVLSSGDNDRDAATG